MVNHYDIILRNNASNQTFLISRQESVSDSPLYLEFNGIDLPKGAKGGEYTYSVILNNRDDVEYDFSTDLDLTVLHTGEGDVFLKDLFPITGILKVGEVVPSTIHIKDRNRRVYYYERKA